MREREKGNSMMMMMSILWHRVCMYREKKKKEKRKRKLKNQYRIKESSKQRT
jgi:hypothetical protein